MKPARALFFVVAWTAATAYGPDIAPPSPFGIVWGEDLEAVGRKLPAARIEKWQAGGGAVYFDASGVLPDADFAFVNVLERDPESKRGGAYQLAIEGKAFGGDPTASSLLRRIEEIRETLADKYGKPKCDISVDPFYVGQDAALGFQMGRSRYVCDWRWGGVFIFLAIDRAGGGRAGPVWTLSYTHADLNAERARRIKSKAADAL